MDDERQHMHDNGALLAADGSPRLPHVGYDDDGYAHSDGAPLSQNDSQAVQLFYAFPALKALVRRRFPGAFAGCDMFVYPRRRGRGIAPDIFIAFGAGELDRRGRRRNSYKLFEGEPVPSFVMEVLSGTTADKDLGPKRDAYAEWGVAEYWMFDPFDKHIPGCISAEQLVAGAFEPIAPLPGTSVYRSAVLGVEMRAEDCDLRIYDPETGEDLRSLSEEYEARRIVQDRAEAAEQRAADAERRAAEEAAARKALEAELAELRRTRRNAPS